MDNAMKGLLMKEWKMMKGFLFGNYIIAIIILLFPGNGSLFDGLSMLLTLGLIVVPAAVLFSLNMETNQRQSFLHNPQSAHKLLLAKLIYSVGIAVVFLIIISLAITGYEFVEGASALNVFETFFYLLNLSLITILMSLYPLAIILFVWTLHQIWRTYVGSGISIIFVVIMIVGGSRLMAFLGEFHLYKVVTHWGVVAFPINKFSHTNLELGFLASVPIGSYLFYGIITTVLYFISVYLLDRKVEV